MVRGTVGLDALAGDAGVDFEPPRGPTVRRPFDLSAFAIAVSFSEERKLLLREDIAGKARSREDGGGRRKRFKHCLGACPHSTRDCCLPVSSTGNHGFVPLPFQSESRFSVALFLPLLG